MIEHNAKVSINKVCCRMLTVLTLMKLMKNPIITLASKGYWSTGGTREAWLCYEKSPNIKARNDVDLNYFNGSDSPTQVLGSVQLLVQRERGSVKSS